MQGFKAAELSDILLRINNNPQLIDSLSFAAAQYISQFKSWEDVHKDIRKL